MSLRDYTNQKSLIIKFAIYVFARRDFFDLYILESLKVGIEYNKTKLDFFLCFFFSSNGILF